MCVFFYVLASTSLAASASGVLRRVFSLCKLSFTVQSAFQGLLVATSFSICAWACSHDLRLCCIPAALILVHCCGET